MRRSCLALARWLAAAWLQGLGWLACRQLPFDKFRMDFDRQERTIERKLRRKVRKSVRHSLDRTRD